MMVIDNVSPKLQTVKNFVRPLFKKRRFGTRFDGQHVKVSRILANLHESTFIMFFVILREVHLENVCPSNR